MIRQPWNMQYTFVQLLNNPYLNVDHTIPKIGPEPYWESYQALFEQEIVGSWMVGEDPTKLYGFEH